MTGDMVEEIGMPTSQHKPIDLNDALDCRCVLI